jgi:hypothetical protein
MKLVVILGSGAVGKMTVGQELAKVTGLRLFHNHMGLEMVMEVFGDLRHGRGGITNRIRKIIFEEFVKTDHYGMIFTYMLAFDVQSDVDKLDSLVDIFRRENAEIYYVELVASQEIRLQRNATENRLLHKPSKRDIEASNHRIIHNEDAKYRLVSNDGEMSAFENYIKIDNSHIAPDVVAQTIKEKFNL